MAKQSSSDLLTIQDVMATFNISRRTVYLWIEKKTLLPIKIEGILRFHRDDIRTLIENNRGNTRSSQPKKKILAVDDDVLVRESLKIILQRFGYDVTVLGSGQEVLQHLAASSAEYDLLITDVRMPGMDGIQMLQELHRLRQQKHLCALREIVITGYSDLDAEKQAQALGVRSFIMKPFQINEFDQEIKKVLADCPTVCN